jgi:hypothetical protein
MVILLQILKPEIPSITYSLREKYEKKYTKKKKHGRLFVISEIAV